MTLASTPNGFVIASVSYAMGGCACYRLAEERLPRPLSYLVSR
jgi:hypothetical protein